MEKLVFTKRQAELVSPERINSYTVGLASWLLREVGPTTKQVRKGYNLRGKVKDVGGIKA